MKPLLRTLSNSKLPFWFTGEKVSRLRWPLRGLVVVDCACGGRVVGETKAAAEAVSIEEVGAWSGTFVAGC